MDHTDTARALADGRGHPLARARSHVADGEDPWHVRLEWERVTVQRPGPGPPLRAGRQIRPGEDVALVIELDEVGDRLGVGGAAHEDEYGGGVETAARSRGQVPHEELLEMALAGHARDLGTGE